MTVRLQRHQVSVFFWDQLRPGEPVGAICGRGAGGTLRHVVLARGSSKMPRKVQRLLLLGKVLKPKPELVPVPVEGYIYEDKNATSQQYGDKNAMRQQCSAR